MEKAERIHQQVEVREEVWEDKRNKINVAEEEEEEHHAERTVEKQEVGLIIRKIKPLKRRTFDLWYEVFNIN